MAITKHVQHPKSSATTANTESVTVPRLPSSGDLLYGEIAVNYKSEYETLSIRNSANQIVPFPTNNHPITASTTEGLINGQIGIDNYDVEAFYIYNNQRSTWQPVSTNHVPDEATLEGIPTVQDPQFAYVSDTGLLYSSQYDSSTSSQTWSALATLNPDSKRLADSQEPKVIIDNFTTDPDYALTRANILVFDVNAKKLKQYGRLKSQGGVMTPELLHTYDPSKNVIYYNIGSSTAYRWTGTVMTPILEGPTISTDNTMSAVTGNNTVTVSSNVFSANTAAGVIVYKMTPANSANSYSHATYSHIFGAKNTVNWSSGVTTFGFNNTVASGANYSFAEGSGNTVSGVAAHAEGVSTSAVGASSHAAGSGTITNNVAEFACGRYNDSLTGKAGTTLFTVGNGTGVSARQNALEVHADGKIYFMGAGAPRCLQDILERLGGY